MTDWKLELFNCVGKICKEKVKNFLRLQNTTAKVLLFCMFPEEDQSGQFAVVLIKVGGIQ